MDKLTIRTNRQEYDILYWWDLTPKERDQFDYHQSTYIAGERVAVADDEIAAQFFRYRGVTYDLGEFQTVPHYANEGPAAWPNGPWNGVASDSYFSGVVVYLTELSTADSDPRHYDYSRGDTVIVGTYFS